MATRSKAPPPKAPPPFTSRPAVRAGGAIALVAGAGLLYFLSERRTFASDVRAICSAEAPSETTIASGGRIVVESFARKNMHGSDGLALLEAMKAAPPETAGQQLRAAADKAGVTECVAAESYTALGGRAALMRAAEQMCSTLNPAELSHITRAKRFAHVREWARKEAGDSGLDKMLGSIDTGTLEPTTIKLRKALSDLDIHACGMLSGLASPLDPTAGPNALVQRVGVQSDTREGAVTEAMRAKSPAFRDCYAAGLAKDPKLYGAMSIKFRLVESGAIDFAIPQDDSTLNAPEVVTCILDVVKSVVGPPGPVKSPGGLVLVLWVAK